jgi:dTDP-4-dehydrorhamnose reductase
MRVLVTGATGRVGANMVARLLASGADVRAMVMPGDPQAVKLSTMSGLEIVEAELTDQAAIDAACRDVTHVVHLAAQLVRGETPVDRFFDINAFGTLRLLEGVVKAGGVERFLLASTDGTYRPGDPPMVPLPEDAPQEPADYYGTSKLLGETILRNHAAQFDIPYVITRFATVLDPVEAAGLFRVSWMRALLRKAELGRDTNIWQLFRGHPTMARIFDSAVRDAPDETAAGLLGPDGQPWSLHLLEVRSDSRKEPDFQHRKVQHAADVSAYAAGVHKLQRDGSKYFGPYDHVGHMRRMLETIREYASEQLAAGGEEREHRSRHADYYVAYAQHQAYEIIERDDLAAFAASDREHDNILAALEWLLADEGPRDGGAAALRLVESMGWYWYTRGHDSGAADRFERYASVHAKDQAS